MPLYKHTQYSSYNAYCNGMRQSMVDGGLSTREGKDIIVIWDALDKIFGLPKEMTRDLIVEYFASDNINNFANYNQLIKDMFPYIESIK